LARLLPPTRLFLGALPTLEDLSTCDNQWQNGFGFSVNMRNCEKFPHPAVTFSFRRFCGVSLASVDHDGIGQKNRVGDEKRFRFVLKGCVPQIDADHVPFQPRDHDPITPPKRVIEKDHNTGENVRKRVTKRETEGEPRETQTRYQRGDIDPQRAHRGDRAENQNRRPGYSPNQNQNGLLIRICSSANPANDFLQHRAQAEKREEDQQGKKYLNRPNTCQVGEVWWQQVHQVLHGIWASSDIALDLAGKVPGGSKSGWHRFCQGG